MMFQPSKLETCSSKSLRPTLETKPSVTAGTKVSIAANKEARYHIHPLAGQIPLSTSQMLRDGLMLPKSKENVNSENISHDTKDINLDAKSNSTKPVGATTIGSAGRDERRRTPLTRLPSHYLPPPGLSLSSSILLPEPQKLTLRERRFKSVKNKTSLSNIRQLFITQGGTESTIPESPVPDSPENTGIVRTIKSLVELRVSSPFNPGSSSKREPKTPSRRSITKSPRDTSSDIRITNIERYQYDGHQTPNSAPLQQNASSEASRFNIGTPIRTVHSVSGSNSNAAKSRQGQNNESTEETSTSMLAPMEYARFYQIRKAQARRFGTACDLPPLETVFCWTEDHDDFLIIPKIPRGFDQNILQPKAHLEISPNIESTPPCLSLHDITLSDLGRFSFHGLIDGGLTSLSSVPPNSCSPGEIFEAKKGALSHTQKPNSECDIAKDYSASFPTFQSSWTDRAAAATPSACSVDSIITAVRVPTQTICPGTNADPSLSSEIKVTPTSDKDGVGFVSSSPVETSSIYSQKTEYSGDSPTIRCKMPMGATDAEENWPTMNNQLRKTVVSTSPTGTPQRLVRDGQLTALSPKTAGHSRDTAEFLPTNTPSKEGHVPTDSQVMMKNFGTDTKTRTDEIDSATSLSTRTSDIYSPGATLQSPSSSTEPPKVLPETKIPRRPRIDSFPRPAMHSENHTSIRVQDHRMSERTPPSQSANRKHFEPIVDHATDIRLGRDGSNSETTTPARLRKMKTGLLLIDKARYLEPRPTVGSDDLLTAASEPREWRPSVNGRKKSQHVSSTRTRPNGSPPPRSKLGSNNLTRPGFDSKKPSGVLKQDHSYSPPVTRSDFSITCGDKLPSVHTRVDQHRHRKATAHDWNSPDFNAKGIEKVAPTDPRGNLERGTQYRVASNSRSHAIPLVSTHDASERQIKQHARGHTERISQTAHASKRVLNQSGITCHPSDRRTVPDVSASSMRGYSQLATEVEHVQSISKLVGNNLNRQSYVADTVRRIPESYVNPRTIETPPHFLSGWTWGGSGEARKRREERDEYFTQKARMQDEVVERVECFSYKTPRQKDLEYEEDEEEQEEQKKKKKEERERGQEQERRETFGQRLRKADSKASIKNLLMDNEAIKSLRRLASKTNILSKKRMVSRASISNLRNLDKGSALSHPPTNNAVMGMRSFLDEHRLPTPSHPDVTLQRGFQVDGKEKEI
jgi:hypothetical protein